MDDVTPSFILSHLGQRAVRFELPFVFCEWFTMPCFFHRHLRLASPPWALPRYRGLARVSYWFMVNGNLCLLLKSLDIRAFTRSNFVSNPYKSLQASPVHRNRPYSHEYRNLKAFICWLVFHFLRFGDTWYIDYITYIPYWRDCQYILDFSGLMK